DHADKYETSLMMALHPHLVQMDKYRRELVIPYDYSYRENAWGYHSPEGRWVFADDLEQEASRELGERLVSAIVSHLTARIEAEFTRLT
ncbi:MAG: creatininase family protein, partial [Armatimonadetes bacterium]|nr:creatininase family protein [Armatimonadota bacterium]